MRILQHIVSGVVAGAVWACASSVDTAPGLPDDRMAVLQWGRFSFRPITVHARTIDGQDVTIGIIPGIPDLLISGRCCLPAPEARLHPGRHAIAYKVLGDWGFSIASGSFSLDMEAGRVYAMNTVKDDATGTVSVWIEDESTGEWVAGWNPLASPVERERHVRAREQRLLAQAGDDVSLAATCGDASAQYQLGLAYLTGNPPGGSRDLVEAYVWFALAAGNGHSDADAVRERIASELSPDQRTRAEALLDDVRRTPCPPPKSAT